MRGLDAVLRRTRAAWREAQLAGEPENWQRVSHAKIERMLDAARNQPEDGWHAVLRSKALRPGYTARVSLEGRAYVAWRGHDGEAPTLAPASCPHMGANLVDGWVDTAGALRCPWHGLALSCEGRGAWQVLTSYDDGQLIWARPGAGTPRPLCLSQRPSTAVTAVVQHEAQCEAEDILANRLDPWHGAHFHPHTFKGLEVLSEQGSTLTVRVSFRLAGALSTEVEACFSCPTPRCITMRILSGEGRGSLVETHATALGPGRTQVLELSMACSDRPNFSRLAPVLRPLLVPWLKRRAARLWTEDCAYAEARYRLRQARHATAAA